MLTYLLRPWLKISFLWIATILSSSSPGQSILDLPAVPSDKLIDITTSTPEGRLRPGADVTAALQWAIDNVHLSKQPLLLPAGEWRISKTIRTNFKSGLTLVGSGVGLPIDDDKPGAARFVGARTLIRWAGKPGGTMFEVTGSDVTIGDFVLQGDRSGKSKGIVILKSENGIGVGNILFRSLSAFDLETAVQCGTTREMHNCDNLRFEWFRVERCKRGYHGVNTMGMNIHFDQLNAGAMPAVIEMDGGGKLTVAKSVIVGPCTLLKVNGGGGVGKNNGYFRLSNTELDAQAGSGFTLIDCAEPEPIEFYCDGGIQAQMDTYQGTFARLSGGNHLTLCGWDSSFRNITGTRDVTYGRPTVMIRDSRIWGKVDSIWQGAINARWRDCVSVPWKSDSVWLDGSATK
ncbi:hypothetical protein [Aeoliella sp. SH292]|uniref:hypothetical protein n=1 Tax=Aeoliella sp. SH292 TaxID=3454464 RepID=UPI003F98D688